MRTNKERFCHSGRMYRSFGDDATISAPNGRTCETPSDSVNDISTMERSDGYNQPKIGQINVGVLMTVQFLYSLNIATISPSIQQST